MQSAASSANAKRAKTKSRDLGQLDLFAVIAHSECADSETPRMPREERDSVAESKVAQPEPVQSSVVPLRQSVTAKPTHSKRRQKPIEIQIIEEDDLPEYSDAEKAIVDRSLEALPQTKAWFTYADIKQTFTISRATVVRRVKSGVVPGIRFAGDRVLEDGTIRRFTREQVRYLLLAIRRPA